MKRLLLILFCLTMTSSFVMAQEQTKELQDKELQEEDLVEPQEFADGFMRFRMTLIPGKGSGTLVQDFGGAPSLRYDFEDSFGMDESSVLPELEVAFRIAPLAEMYFTGSYGLFPGTKDLTSPLTYRGTTFASGQELESFQSLFMGEIGFMFEATKSDSHYLAFGLGVRYMRFKTALKTDSQDKVEGVQEGAVMTIRLRGDFRLFGFTFLYFDGTAGGFANGDDINSDPGDDDYVANASGRAFAYLRGEVGLKFALVPQVNMFVGAYYSRVYIKRREDGIDSKVDFDLKGVSLSLQVEF